MFFSIFSLRFLLFFFSWRFFFVFPCFLEEFWPVALLNPFSCFSLVVTVFVCFTLFLDARWLVANQTSFWLLRSSFSFFLLVLFPIFSFCFLVCLFLSRFLFFCSFCCAYLTFDLASHARKQVVSADMVLQHLALSFGLWIFDCWLDFLFVSFWTMPMSPSLSLLSLPLTLAPSNVLTTPSFVVAETDTILWQCAKSWRVKAKVRAGDVFLAASHVTTANGWRMLPVVGGGAIQCDLFRAAARKDFVVNEGLIVRDVDLKLQTSTRVIGPRFAIAQGPGCIPWTSPLRLPTPLTVPTPKAGCGCGLRLCDPLPTDYAGLFVTQAVFAVWFLHSVLEAPFHGLWHLQAPWLVCSAYLRAIAPPHRLYLMVCVAATFFAAPSSSTRRFRALEATLLLLLAARACALFCSPLQTTFLPQHCTPCAPCVAIAKASLLWDQRTSTLMPWGTSSLNLILSLMISLPPMMPPAGRLHTNSPPMEIGFSFPWFLVSLMVLPPTFSLLPFVIRFLKAT